MSNTNRLDTKPSNIKLARYLQRIEQLVGTRGRTPSPISQKANKIIKHNTLDHYVKYELTIKLICGVQSKKNNFYLRYFFNTLKQNYKNNISIHNTQRKVETIYKFVPIQKAECPHVMIDTGISIRILGNILKLKIKDHLKFGFDAIKATNLVQNQVLLTGRSLNDKSKSMVKSRIIDNEKNILKLQRVMERKIKNRENLVFSKLKRIEEEEKRQKYLSKEREHQIQRQKQREQQMQKQKQLQKKLSYQIDKLKIQLFIKVFKKISQRKVIKGFNRVYTFSLGHRIQEQKIEMQKVQNQQINAITQSRFKEKLNTIAILFFTLNVKKAITQIARAAQNIKGIKGERRNQQEIQDLKRLVQAVKQNQRVKQVSGRKVNDNLVQKTYEFTNKINLSLISIIFRLKMEFFKKIQIENEVKKKQTKLRLETAFRTLAIRGDKNVAIAWNKMLLLSKIEKQEELSNLAIQKTRKFKNWSQIGSLIDLQILIGLKSTLEFSFQKIKNYENLGQSRQHQFTFDKRQELQKGNLRKNYGIMKTNIKPPQQFLILPRIIQKLYLLKSIQTFIKIKFYQGSRNSQESKLPKKKSGRRQTEKLELSHQNIQNKADRIIQSPISPINALRQQSQKSLSNEWYSDIKSFISEREHFNQYIEQNYQKLDKMLQSKETNNSTSQISKTNSGILNTNRNEIRKYIKAQVTSYLD